ncbi:2-dehydro-3-deoxy-6-phosphogalactonate aldolase [Prosthecomicrobium hirschii]|uniref:2-dehydro-3-deoxy-6-phosphogalactonate aldolase n=1 Tax=Prosthecodimorpha hirschii TaxID=665126 RepID=UPI00112ADEDE|nr:2-dehydro-3-deoxy-6-phosphogalactonate aldolase [Prosthecomicrobium hirschii]TPQ50121.1 2-dehydro-3-deoxy-6-phosphogalactonate aldolase [Prosthecomicrobium hirschii]
MTFDEAFAALPLIAILRGIRPDEAEPIVAGLIEAGFRLIEVPLNSPDPFATIAALQARFAGRALLGAGTVLSVAEVAAVAATGARLIVSPNTDPAVIGASKAAGLVSLPGAATPSEAFAALAAGADAVKMFPAEALPPALVKAWRAVLPRNARLIPVGGIDVASMAPYRAAGADGFGLGSALYRPGQSAEATAGRAVDFVSACRNGEIRN